MQVRTLPVLPARSSHHRTWSVPDASSILNYPHVFLKGMIISSNYAMIKSESINSACIVIQ